MTKGTPEYKKEYNKLFEAEVMKQYHRYLANKPNLWIFQYIISMMFYILLIGSIGNVLGLLPLIFPIAFATDIIIILAWAMFLYIKLKPTVESAIDEQIQKQSKR